MPAGVYQFLADLILVLHFGIVLFIVGGLLLIWAGWFAGWRFVRNRWFRWAHLGAMAIVAAQAVMGVICPLTIWENDLRRLSGEEGRYETTFIEHWFGRLMFFDLDPSAFTVAYVVFLLLVALSWRIVRPGERGADGKTASEQSGA